MKFFIFFILCMGLVIAASSQHFQFAQITDTHIGSSTAAEDLERTVNDINANDSIAFVVITGDVTEFGSDEEIRLAKQILDRLNKKWYIVPGNHDSNWSESGNYTFQTVFGAETFYFTHQGIHFIGTVSGPNMRMSPGQVPRENLVWMDSLLQTIGKTEEIVFINHYPIDNSLNNWYEITNRLKEKTVRFIMCGHGHANRSLNFEGMQGVMGRSNLRARDSIGGYNIIRLNNDSTTYSVKQPFLPERKPWLKLSTADKLVRPKIERPDYAVNDSFPFLKIVWRKQQASDIGSGLSILKRNLYSTNTNGNIIAYKISSGKEKWSTNAGGKIYSIPASQNNVVIAGAANNTINAFNSKNGRLIWNYKTGKAVLGHPTIKNNTVYTGSSDGIFRAINIQGGELKWQNTGIAGFVVTRPLFYGYKIYFGSWGREFYCLDAISGEKIWQWDNGHASRMYSPAAVFPKAVNNRVFIVAPDRYMTCLNAVTGNVIWRKQDSLIRVRESMGLSADSSLIYVKTMDGEVLGISTSADQMQVAWKGDVNLGYEISPTEIIEHNGVVFVPTQSGTVVALDRQTGKLLAKHKLSNGLITSIIPVAKNSIAVSTMDGVVAVLKMDK